MNQKKAKNDFKKYLITPEQEFVEAHSFLAIVENKEIPSLKSQKFQRNHTFWDYLIVLVSLKDLY